MLLRVIGVAVVVVGIFASGWIANGWRKDAQIERMKTTDAKADLSSANAALGDLRAAGQTIRAKADEFNVAQTTLGAKIDVAMKEFRNAKKSLPVDCRPDDFRLRKLSDAVDAAKQAAAPR